MPIQTPGNGCEQILRGHGLPPGVQKHETARAVSVLGLPRVEAGLPKERGLLVSSISGNRDGSAEQAGGRLTHDLARGIHLGQDFRRNLKFAEDLVVPPPLVDVEQQRP